MGTEYRPNPVFKRYHIFLHMKEAKVGGPQLVEDFLVRREEKRLHDALLGRSMKPRIRPDSTIGGDSGSVVM